ncbi:MAG: hypothetical protein AAB861_02550 [Patescibacteria group bacterium]
MSEKVREMLSDYIDLHSHKIRNGICEYYYEPAISKLISKERCLANKKGVLKYDGNKLFYKVLPIKDYRMEVIGSNFIRQYYPSPKIIFCRKLSKNYGILLFEYEKSIGCDRGLLVDIFSGKEKPSLAFKKILGLYRNVFSKTITKDYEKSSYVFFNDRIETRLKKYYRKKAIKSIQNVEIKVNGYTININLEEIINNIEKFFLQKTKKWCVASQCDPNDLNIGIKPVIVDCRAGGMNPVMAEFASFFWNNLAHGGYFGPLYRTRFYHDHPAILKKTDKVIKYKNKITHKIPRLRKKFICDYIDIVLVSLFKRIGRYDQWYDEFKNYLSMRILCICSILDMQEKDLLLSLGYLGLFYNNDIDNLDKLKKIIKKL